MNNKITSMVIIGLCFISILVGVISSYKPATSPAKGNSTESFSNLVSSGGSKIALISLEGEISPGEASSGFLGNVYSADSVEKSLKKAFKDNSVKGIVLKINSPGGTVAASQQIYGVIMKNRGKKPVVVSMVDVAASGGYYIASAADRIYAYPGTLTGSVGVILSSFDAHQLLNQKLGISANVIKSGKYKDIASPYRPMAPDERSMLQTLINTTHEQFVKAIIDGRVKRTDKYSAEKKVLKEEVLRTYADGRILLGEQAYKIGFVDSLGGVDDAHAAASKIAKEKFHLISDEIPLIPYNRTSGLSSLFAGMSESKASKEEVYKSLIPFSFNHPRQLLYLWE